MRLIFLGVTAGVLRLSSALLIPALNSSPHPRYIFSLYENLQENHWWEYWLSSSGDSWTSNGHIFNAAELPHPSLSCPVGPLEGCIGPSKSNDGSQGNWILDLTTEFNRSLTVLFNYAQLGAMVDSSLVLGDSIDDGIKQIQYPNFEATVANVPNDWANWTSSDALASFFIGINDVGNSFNIANKAEWVMDFCCKTLLISLRFTESVMDQYFDIVQNLYNLGVRDFLFLNLPPTWRTPLFIARKNIHTALQQSIEIYNAQLHERIQLFQAAHSVSSLL